MRVQHNIMALNANRNLGMNNSNVSKSLEKLSSGYRINRAADDAAGLAISEKMRAQISCLTQAETNCNDGISLIQTAEGALTEVHDMLNRMVELAEQSANGTYTDEIDRTNLQDEVSQLQAEIDRIAKSTNFNGIKLLDGSLGGNSGATTDSTAKFITLSGGKLSANDAINFVSNDTTGALKAYADGDFKIGGETIKAAQIGAGAGITMETKFTPEKDDDGNNLAYGSYTVKLTVNDKTKITAAAAEAIGEGLTISFKTNATPAANEKFVKFVADGKANGLKLQIGDTSDDFNQLTVNVNNMDCNTLGVDDVDVSTQEGAAKAVAEIKTAINSVSSTRGSLGAMQNRLEHTVNNLSVTNENITNAESRIRDTDMAKEMMTYTSKNILSQAAQSMLAQANQVPQQVLSLLQ